MKLKSMQFSIMLYAGACILAIVVALVSYALISGSREQAAAANGTQELLEQLIQQRVTALAQFSAVRLQKELEAPLNISKSLANLGAQASDQSAGRLPLARADLNRLVQDIMQRHPELLGAYYGFEPNSFADDDAQYIGENGHDANGRFIPYWFRNEDGSLGHDLLVGMESEKRSETGVREGEYYLCPKESKIACLPDPYVYEIAGKPIMMASFTAPILLEGRFHGIAGSDLSVDFIQKMLTSTNQSLYDGAGTMAIVSTNGSLVAYTADPSRIGEIASKHIQNKNLSSEQTTYSLDPGKGLIELVLPFAVADTSAKWKLSIQIPLEVAMRDAMKLQSDLKTQHDSNLFGMAAVGLAIASLGLLVLWFVSLGIARPLKQMVVMLNDIARGEGDLTKRLNVDRADELGTIAKSFNLFLSKLQTMITAVVTSVEKVSDASGHTAEIAISTNRGVQRQQVEIDQVATAIHEMSATAQDVAANASKAAEAALRADESAALGKSIVQNSTKAIVELAEEINLAVSSVGSLARNSEAITAIVTSIRSIAEQTNLLALNAAIEAARAGDQGRGFAVVADEVRNLAQKTQQATQEINGMIHGLQEDTLEVVKVMQNSQDKAQVSVKRSSETVGALAEITEAISVINELNAQIASAAEEQSAVAEDINRNVTTIGMVASEVADGADKASRASEQLTQMAEQQRSLVSQFKV
ncbi:methyl-accepting chemotaxis protein [Stutzerimonas zhaodongensis]|uniref:methyl-accepting chemotaxis protein n=1 Tax=Stutzerimonas zhaodongensis TaxID=1176257 RepID=UPI0039F0D89C